MKSFLLFLNSILSIFISDLLSFNKIVKKVELFGKWLGIIIYNEQSFYNFRVTPK